jgi:hypothetical protein
MTQILYIWDVVYKTTKLQLLQIFDAYPKQQEMMIAYILHISKTFWDGNALLFVVTDVE